MTAETFGFLMLWAFDREWTLDPRLNGGRELQRFQFPLPK